MEKQILNNEISDPGRKLPDRKRERRRKIEKRKV